MIEYADIQEGLNQCLGGDDYNNSTTEQKLFV